MRIFAVITAPRCCMVAVALGMASCGPEIDPLTRHGMWHPIQANRDNLTLMVANPADLVRGIGTGTADGQLAAAAVDRLRTDKVKKLPASDIANVASGANESSATGAP